MLPEDCWTRWRHCPEPCRRCPALRRPASDDGRQIRWLRPTGDPTRTSSIVIIVARDLIPQTRFIIAELVGKVSVPYAQVWYLILWKFVFHSLIIISDYQRPVPDRGWGYQAVRVCKPCYQTTVDDVLNETGQNNIEPNEVQVRKVGETVYGTVSSLATALEFPINIIKDTARYEIFNCK